VINGSAMLPTVLGPASFFQTRRLRMTTGQKLRVRCGAA
jgi:hypothetical protein